MSSSSEEPAARTGGHGAGHRPFLDWLRVAAIGAVFVFHSVRFFDTDDWHVKNPTTWFGVSVWTAFLVNWLMPLIFVVSGAGVFHALGRRGAGRFIRERAGRLLVPLVVGIFTHVLVQVYLERLSHHQFSGTLFEFIPRYFHGWYGLTPGGNFAWMGLHLWYLLVLFVFSALLALPLRLLRGSGELLRKAGDLVAGPGAVYLLALPLMLLFALSDPGSFPGNRGFGGWSLANYLLFFVYGFLLMSHDGLQRRVARQRWVSLAGGLLCLAALFASWVSAGDPRFGTPRYALVFSLFALSSWCWVLTFFGFASRHFDRPSPRLGYLNEAVLPFYAMHQSVLIYLGYFVVGTGLPDPLKWLVIALSSLVLLALLYELPVRRVGALRFLFGLKPAARTEPRRQGSAART